MRPRKAHQVPAIQPFRRRLTSGGTLFQELRWLWLQLAFWQLLLAVVAAAAAIAARNPVSVGFGLVAVLAFVAYRTSLRTWRRSR